MHCINYWCFIFIGEEDDGRKRLWWDPLIIKGWLSFDNLPPRFYRVFRGYSTKIHCWVSIENRWCVVNWETYLQITYSQLRSVNWETTGLSIEKHFVVNWENWMRILFSQLRIVNWETTGLSIEKHFMTLRVLNWESSIERCRCDQLTSSFTLSMDKQVGMRYFLN